MLAGFASEIEAGHQSFLDYAIDEDLPWTPGDETDSDAEFALEAFDECLKEIFG